MIRDTLRRFAGEPPAIRVHTALRALSCPFEEILASVPRGARLLDYGCGHGTFAALAADRTGARATGVDIDERKVAVARRSASPPAAFHVIEPGSTPPGPWDAITVIDVLYLLTPPEQRTVLMALAAELAPGGALLVKEMHRDSHLKTLWMEQQERVMVQVLKRTKGAHLAFTDPAHLRAALQDAGLSTSERAVDRWYPHPHHLIVAKRRGDGDG